MSDHQWRNLWIGVAQVMAGSYLLGLVTAYLIWG